MNPRLSLLAILALAACEQPAAPLPSRPWTTFDLQRAYNTQTRVLVGVEGAPDGFPHDAFVKGGQPLIPISSAFTEGGFSPYITTNLWANFPEVWVQPMYILVTGWNAEKHDWDRLPGAGWIYTVSEQSRFHSPFWRVYWAEVPPGTPADKYTSSAQLLRNHVPLTPGPGRLVTVVPDGTVLDQPPTSPFAIPELMLPAVRSMRDYLDGRKISAIDFGPDRFEWNEYLEVVEQPFFVLVTCSSRTVCGPSGAPNIGGTGPLFERRPAIVPNRRPRFGSFWRLYFVTLPAGEGPGLYIPASVEADTREGLRSKLSALPAPVPGFKPDPEHEAEVNRHYMQVALNAATCFASQEAFAGCQWLDSQRAIEERLPQAIKRTGITVTCPFVGYDGMDVRE